MPSEYTLDYMNPAGVPITELQFSSFDLACKENDIGVLNINFSPKMYPPNFFVRDGIIEVRRKLWVNNTSLIGKTFWLIRRISFKVDDSGQEMAQITCQDAMSILKRRIVAYQTSDGTPTAPFGNSKKIDFADDMMKAVVRENYTVLALDALRDISSWFSVEDNLSLGAIVSRELGWQNVFDSLVSISNSSSELGSRILFSLERTAPAKLKFRTHLNYMGADHTAGSLHPVIVSQDLGNLSTPEMTFDYFDEKTVSYALGAGANGVKQYETYIDNARIYGPYGRVESTVDAGDQTDPTVLVSIAKENTYKGRPRLIFDGIVLDSLLYQYGSHYEYGDLVTAQYRGYALDCALSTLGISFDNKAGEQIQLRMHGEVLL